MNNNLYITWKDENNIGVPIIDEQHRGIISAINSIYYTIQHENNPIAIKSILVLLEQYTQFHFLTEESLMRKAKYPAYEDHLKLHGILVERTRQQLIDYGQSADASDVLRFLKDWWLYHILKEDQKYIPFMFKYLKIDQKNI